MSETQISSRKIYILGFCFTGLMELQISKKSQFLHFFKITYNKNIIKLWNVPKMRGLLDGRAYNTTPDHNAPRF